MKKILTLLLLGAVISGAYAVGVSLELDGRSNKMKMEKTEGLVCRHPQNKSPDRIYYVEAYSKENVTPEWKKYEFSFIPEKSGSFTLGLSATYIKDSKIHWIDYDKLEVVNAVLENTSFEQLSWKKELYRWLKYLR